MLYFFPRTRRLRWIIRMVGGAEIEGDSVEVPTRPQPSHQYSSKALAGVKKASRHWFTVPFIGASICKDRCAIAACWIRLWGQVEHVSTVWMDP